MSVALTGRTLVAVKPSGDAELDQEVWLATMKEVEAGFLTGPFLPSEAPKGHVASSRT